RWRTSRRPGCRRSRHRPWPRGSRGGSDAFTQVEPLVRVGCYAPVEDDGLGDLLPDGLGGHVAVVEGPVLVAAREVRLAHDDHHREARMLSWKEPDERRPHIQRVAAVDRDLRGACLARLVELEASDA